MCDGIGRGNPHDRIGVHMTSKNIPQAKNSPHIYMKIITLFFVQFYLFDFQFSSNFARAINDLFSFEGKYCGDSWNFGGPQASLEIFPLQ